MTVRRRDFAEQVMMRTGNQPEDEHRPSFAAAAEAAVAVAGGGEKTVYSFPLSRRAGNTDIVAQYLRTCCCKGLPQNPCRAEGPRVVQTRCFLNENLFRGSL